MTKRIRTIKTRPSTDVRWYWDAVSNKSNDFLNFIIWSRDIATIVSNTMDMDLPSILVMDVTVDVDDVNYDEYCSRRDVANADVDAYDAANGIIKEVIVTDV